MKKTAAAALSALALAGSMMLAAPAHAITNPAANPNPKTVKGDDGRTYEDGRDTLPGYDDEECSYIPGAWYDFDNNLVHYADGQSARWTEWDRVAGYQKWLATKNATKSSGSASTSASGGTKAPTATGTSSGSTKSSTGSTTSKSSTKQNAASGSPTKKTTPAAPVRSTASSPAAPVAAEPEKAGAEGAHEPDETTASVESEAAAAAKRAERKREKKESEAAADRAELEAERQAGPGAGAHAVEALSGASTDGATLDARLASADSQPQAGPTNDTTLAGLGILAALAAVGALALGGWGVLGVRARKGGAQ